MSSSNLSIKKILATAAAAFACALVAGLASPTASADLLSTGTSTDPDTTTTCATTADAAGTSLESSMVFSDTAVWSLTVKMTGTSGLCDTAVWSDTALVTDAAIWSDTAIWSITAGTCASTIGPDTALWVH
jgi:hypothetical protein